jgi:thioredoxin 1
MAPTITQANAQSNTRVVKVDDVNVFSEICATYDYVIVDVYADWCMPCKHLAPLFDSLSNAYSTADIIFIKVHADSDIVQVRGLPTIQFYFKQELQPELTIVGSNEQKLTQTVEMISSLATSTRNPVAGNQQQHPQQHQQQHQRPQNNRAHHQPSKYKMYNDSYK